MEHILLACVNLICYDINDDDYTVKYPTEVVSIQYEKNEKYGNPYYWVSERTRPVEKGGNYLKCFEE